MKPEQIFIGNIRKCTKYEEHTTFKSQTFIDSDIIDTDTFGYIVSDDELYKENAILLKIKQGGYVDIERLNSILDHIKMHKNITKRGFILGGLIMSTSSHCIDSLFVDESSLKPYYNNKQQKNISVRQLKKQIKK